MQSGKYSKKSSNSAEQNIVISEANKSAETLKTRKRSAKAATSSEDTLSAKPVKSMAKTDEKASAKPARHRAARPASVKETVIESAAPEMKEIAAVPAEIEAANQASDVLTMAAAVGSSEPVAPAPVREITRGEIAELAYSYYAARGYQPGDQQADWLRAEAELSVRR